MRIFLAKYEKLTATRDIKFFAESFVSIINAVYWVVCLLPFIAVAYYSSYMSSYLNPSKQEDIGSLLALMVVSVIALAVCILLMYCKITSIVRNKEKEIPGIFRIILCGSVVVFAFIGINLFPFAGTAGHVIVNSAVVFLVVYVICWDIVTEWITDSIIDEIIAWSIKKQNAHAKNRQKTKSYNEHARYLAKQLNLELVGSYGCKLARKGD